MRWGHHLSVCTCVCMNVCSVRTGRRREGRAGQGGGREGRESVWGVRLGDERVVLEK